MVHMTRLLLFSLLAASPAALAQDIEFSASAAYAAFGGGPIGYLGYGQGNAPANAVRMKSGPAYGFRFGVNAAHRLGHEFGATCARHDLEYDVADVTAVPIARSTWHVFYDLLVYATPEDAAVRPYVAAGAGAGFFRARVAAPWLGKQESNELALNYGAGAKVRVSKNWFVRFDYREYAGPKPLELIGQKGWLRERETSAGAGFRF